MDANQSETKAGMNVFNRIMNVFVAPSQTFEALIAKPDWATPLIFIFLVFLTTSTLLKDVIQREQAVVTKESIMKNPNIPDGQKEQTAEQAISMMKKFWAVGIGVGMIMVVVIYLMGAMLLFLSGSKILKGPGTYVQVLSIFGYCGFIDVLAAIIKIPIMMINQTMRVDTGLGMFLGEEAIRTPLYVFLSKFDLFTFWQLGVLIIGLSILYKFSKEKTAGLVLGLWLLWVLISVGLTAMGMRVGG